jgi:hypothetical protein
MAKVRVRSVERGDLREGEATRDVLELQTECARVEQTSASATGRKRGVVEVKTELSA